MCVIGKKRFKGKIQETERYGFKASILITFG